MRKPEIDWEVLWRAIAEGSVSIIIVKLRDEAYDAGMHEGRYELLTDGVARAAMLNEQSRWLDIAAKADGEVGRVVAKVVATAFGEAADRLRNTPKPTLVEPSGAEVNEFLTPLSDEKKS
jgi:hypothetical protein